MSIAQLLQAAEYLERREREAEHGYASTMPMPDDYIKKKSKSSSTSSSTSSNNKKSQGNRSTHNELEKNRRAHLRHCLERLKDIVPLGTDSSRHTTLGLLTKARAFIKALEEKDRKQHLMKEALQRESRHLKRRLETLMNAAEYRNSRAERTISECSNSTISTISTVSTSSVSTEESDEVDIMGSNSDSDDHSSVESNGSDGGMVVTTKKLSLMDSL